MDEQRESSTRLARIVVIDDHPLVCEGFASLIRNQPDMEFCGAAHDPSSALALIDREQPDLAVVDISLGDGSGLDVIKRAQARRSETRFLIASMHDELYYAERSLQAGAMGYISKQEAIRRIDEAIRTVLSGRIFLSEGASDRLLRLSLGRSEVPTASPLERLTDRELEVLELIGAGRSTREIATVLHLSVKTIETYRDRIRAKLNLATGSELVRFAILRSMEQPRV